MQILGIANSYASAPVNAPTSLSATPTNTDVSISFTAPTNDGGAAITNYEYSFNNSSWTALSPTDAASPVTVSGLTQNTSYTVYLRAVNIVGSGPGSTGVSFTTQGVPTSAPSGLSSIQTDTSVSISFTAAASSTSLTNYEYSFNNSTWTALSPADAVSPITISGLSQNTAYNIYLRGVNAYGSGPGSTATSFTTFGPPTGTTTISSVSVGTTTATVNFSTTAGGSAITGYDYYLTSWVNAGISSSPLNLSGLTSNTGYTVYLRPKNAYGIGPQSAGFGFTTNKAAPLGVHFLVVAGGGGPGGQNNVGVSGGGGGGGYRTSYGTSGRSSGAEGTLNLTNTSYTVSVGAGGGLNASGGNSQFASIVSTGGGKGGTDPTTSGTAGGSGGGAGCTGTGTFPGGAGTAGQGGDGSQGQSVTAQYNKAGCGGGASGNAGADTGGNGLTSTISGSNQGYSGGGKGGRLGTTGATAGLYSGTSYYGGGGSGASGDPLGAQGVVIIRYSTSYDLPSVSGLTYSATTSGAERIITFTGGSGTVTW